MQQQKEVATIKENITKLSSKTNSPLHNRFDILSVLEEGEVLGNEAQVKGNNAEAEVGNNAEAEVRFPKRLNIQDDNDLEGDYLVKGKRMEENKSEHEADAEEDFEANPLEGSSKLSPSSLVKSIRQNFPRPNLTKFAPQQVNMEKGGKRGKGSRPVGIQLRGDQGGRRLQDQLTK